MMIEMIEEWQSAMIKQEQHSVRSNQLLEKIAEKLDNVATTEDLEKMEARLKEDNKDAVEKANGIKDKLLWAMTVALIVLSGAGISLKILA